MVHTELEAGIMVEIYRDYKNSSNFEGVAILLEKKSIGDSYYLDLEEIRIPYTTKSSLTTLPDPVQIQLNKLYQYLYDFCTSNNAEVKDFVRTLKALCSKDIHSYNNMYQEVQLWKDKFLYTPHYINNILRVETKYIVRYFQQKFIKDWRPTLFRLEKWLVEFPTQKHPFTGDILFNSPFRTTRWISIILAISPSEESKTHDLSRFTTYNGRNVLDIYETEDDDEFDGVDIMGFILDDNWVIDEIENDEYYEIEDKRN